MSRFLPASAFAAALLAFALPFGAVSSCDGEEVRFTGVELATFSVSPDDSHRGTLNEQIERNAGALALVTMSAAVLGLLLALSGRGGGGVCASIGLFTMQLLFWAVLLTSDGGDLFVGYWLGLLSFSVAAVLHLVRAVRSRSARGRSSGRYALGRIALVLLPTLAPVALAFTAGCSA